MGKLCFYILGLGSNFADSLPSHCLDKICRSALLKILKDAINGVAKVCRRCPYSMQVIMANAYPRNCLMQPHFQVLRV